MFKAIIVLGVVVASAMAQSLQAVNLCTDTVWVNEVFGGSPPPAASMYSIAPQATATMVASPAGSPGVSLQIFTGCDASGDTCTTGGSAGGNGGQTPFIGGEIAWLAGGGIDYDISVEYGFNRGMQIANADGSCQTIVCNFDPVGAGCPVAGPTVNGYGSCYSPCCASADNCLGTDNCPDATCPQYLPPTDPAGPAKNGDPGCHSDFYHTVCPNTYTFPDDDCQDYGHSPNFDCAGGNSDVTVTICPSAPSTNIDTCGGGQTSQCTFPGTCLATPETRRFLNSSFL